MNQMLPRRSALPGATGRSDCNPDHRSALAAHTSGVSSDSAPGAIAPRPHQSALRKARISLPRHCYFVTTTIANREPILANAPVAKLLVESLLWLQDKNRIRLMGFVIMPDHLHVAFVLQEESRPEPSWTRRGSPQRRSYERLPAPVGAPRARPADETAPEPAPFRARPALSAVLDSFKGYTGKTINELLGRHGPVWQSAYHDHLVRDRKDFETRLSYMHGNPVRKGLVHYEHEFAFSTAYPQYAHWIDWAWLDGIGHAKNGAGSDHVRSRVRRDAVLRNDAPVLAGTDRARKGAPTREKLT